MTITRIDCQFFRDAELGERAHYVALNPSHQPGSLVFAGSYAARDGISSQVAGKLSLEHFVSAVLDFCSARLRNEVKGDMTLEVLEAAFRNANSSVYSFGHRLAAGGRMAASLMGLVIERRSVAAGRVGANSAYLFRGGELYPFFESKSFGSDEASLEKLIGAHSIVSVELACVPIEEGDYILAFSETLDSETELQLNTLLSEAPLRSDVPLADYYMQRILSRLFPEAGALKFAMLAHVGPDSVYLNDPLAR